LAENIRAIVSQRLLKTLEGGKRVVAEVLINTGTMQELISTEEIVEEIEKVFKIKIEKKKVEANFKTTGTHTAEVKLHQDVKANVKVVVIGE
jgi:ribosomal protein L9